jgi:hypothetical protein
MIRKIGLHRYNRLFKALGTMTSKKATGLLARKEVPGTAKICCLFVLLHTRRQQGRQMST